MSPTRSEPRPPARRPEPESPEARGALPERDQWAYVRAAYPLNRGIPHSVDFPGAGA